MLLPSCRIFRGRHAQAALLCAGMLCSVLAKAQSASPADLSMRLLSWMDEYASIPFPTGLDSLEDFKPGWVDEIELRSETDRFELPRQRYLMRFRPKMPVVRLAERDLQRVQREQVLMLGDEARAKAHANALSLLFELAIDQREHILLDTLNQVQLQLVEATRARLSEPNYDIERVLEAEDDLVSITLRQQNLQLSGQGTPPPIPLNQLVELVDIRNNLLVLAANSGLVARGKSDLVVLEAKLALKRAENLVFLDFLQVEYNDREITPREQFNVGAGITLPRPTQNIRAIDELKVEQLEERYKAQLEHAVRKREFLEKIDQLQNDLIRWTSFRDVLAEREARRERLIEVYLSSALSRPEAILQLRRRSIRDSISLLMIEEEIRKGYASLIGRYLSLNEATIQAWILKK